MRHLVVHVKWHNTCLYYTKQNKLGWEREFKEFGQNLRKFGSPKKEFRFQALDRNEKECCYHNMEMWILEDNSNENNPLELPFSGEKKQVIFGGKRLDFRASDWENVRARDLSPPPPPPPPWTKLVSYTPMQMKNRIRGTRKEKLPWHVACT